ncbi:MAG: stage 0 sporulation family protein [Chloroflexota bacterium]
MHEENTTNTINDDDTLLCDTGCEFFSEDEKVSETDEIPLLDVMFKGHRHGAFRNESRLQAKRHDFVVVESDNGIDLGIVSPYGCRNSLKIKLFNEDSVSSLHKIVRIADENDIATFNKNRLEECEIMKKARDLAKSFNLDMKVTDAEWQLDHKRLTIYFTAPTRIDFRELVKELARLYRTRIELRQISAREETKRTGLGIGACGLNLCCTTFLDDFNHVTLEHARTQQLSNNINKLSGSCGRLKCCLLFEYDNYCDAFEGCPPVNSTIVSKELTGKIIKADIFSQTMTLYVDREKKYVKLSFEEVKRLAKMGKVKRPDDNDKSNPNNQPMTDY